ncbi:MAG: LLM class flavin-dependent oxidoreductase, partial [Gammaproteobacteria bacterium]|nr:LLM class flavin-dependent oxidoreductase [Gammaproteobacteria bacterium]
MLIDIILEPDVDPDEITRLGLLAEECGINRLWVQNYAEARDVFMSLVPLARASSRIKLGVMVISPWEMHPLKIANALLTLNEYCNGRAAVCVGGGGEWNAVMDIPTEKRVRAVREATEILKPACGKRALSGYHGEMYKVTRFAAKWVKPALPAPEIYTGAGQPQMVHMSTLHADGIVLSDAVPAITNNLMKIVRDTLPERAADLGPFRVSNFWAWHVKADHEAAMKEARRELIIRSMLEKEHIKTILNEDDCAEVAANLPAFFGAYHDRSGEIRGVPDRIVNALIEGITTTGDLTEMDKHLARLNEFKSAGLDELALRLHDDPGDAIKVIGDQVAP